MCARRSVANPTCGCDPASVFERFTPLARQAVDFARQEAHSLRHKHIGTEHVLLGMLRQDGGTAASVLASLGVTSELVRSEVAHLVLSGQPLAADQIPFTPRVKEVFELAFGEAANLNETQVGTEHLLLAIARENTGVAAHVLDQFDADADKVRSEVMLVLAHGSGGPRGAATPQQARADSIGIDLSPSARRLMMAAAARALEAGRTSVELGDLLEALLSDATTEARLRELGVDVAALRERLRAPGEAPTYTGDLG
jgi:Clp amino terminal domain, pathogenicity island component